MEMTPWRYRLTVTPVGDGPSSGGALFCTWRRLLRLEVAEVASLWGVDEETIDALEFGALVFPTAIDAKCALDQLWLWANQKHPRPEVEAGWPK